MVGLAVMMAVEREIKKFFVHFLIIIAGTPTAVALSGISVITTAPAPILTLLPKVISPMIVAFAPM